MSNSPVSVLNAHDVSEDIESGSVDVCATLDIVAVSDISITLTTSDGTGYSQQL